MKMVQMGQYKAELTLSPRLHVKPLITLITANGSDYSALPRFQAFRA